MLLAQRVHGLGWRATFEALDELARDFGEDTVDRQLERFAGADPALLRALRVNELPRSPMRAVPR